MERAINDKRPPEYEAKLLELLAGMSPKQVLGMDGVREAAGKALHARVVEELERERFDKVYLMASLQPFLETAHTCHEGEVHDAHTDLLKDLGDTLANFMKHEVKGEGRGRHAVTADVRSGLMVLANWVSSLREG
jgi:hypothetical protein